MAGHPPLPQAAVAPNRGVERVLALFGIDSPADLRVAQPILDVVGDAKALVRLAAGPPRPIGELLSQSGRVDDTLIRELLEEQLVTGERLGEVLVRHGHLTAEERDIALEFQRYQRTPATAFGPLRLGWLLVELGHITQDQLADALARQKLTGRPVGEELVAAGYTHERHVRDALGLQRRLVCAALVLALASAPGAFAASGSVSGSVPLSSSAGIDLVVKIPPIATLKIVFQAPSVRITEEDVARGYVEVPDGSRYELRANTSYGLAVRATAEWFREVVIRGLQQELHLGPEGGEFFQLPVKPHVAAGSLAYRFTLAQGVRPGTYPWPLRIAVTPTA